MPASEPVAVAKAQPETTGTVVTEAAMKPTDGYYAPAKTAADPLPGTGIYDWTGVYIGAHAGQRHVRIDGSNFVPGGVGGAAAITDETRQAFSDWLAGGQIGINYQHKRVVFGGELAGSWMNGDVESNCFVHLQLIPGILDASCDARQKWELQLRTRFGYAFWDGRLLPYITGGVALTSLAVNNSFVFPFLGDDFKWGSQSVLVGVAFGGGLQYALTDSISIGAEYLHTQYESGDFSSVGTQNGVPVIDFETHSLRTNAVRAVVNYKLGD